MLLLLLCSFFFQAEDGIRDGTVTGVQTCALPILEVDVPDDDVVLGHERRVLRRVDDDAAAGEALREVIVRVALDLDGRSEERRVGKEWRSRRAHHYRT